jgi:molybdenum cofactor cytidylyltransferase
VIPALILAAGRSSRMGLTKALLPAGREETFITVLVRALRHGGADHIIVIGRPEADDLRAAVDTLGRGVEFVVNPDPDRGQLSSLIAGLDVADVADPRGVLVMPVDMPLVRADTVARVIAAFDSLGAPIVRATVGGRHGHPVVFARSIFEELRRADPAVGAKAVLRAHAEAIVNVEVEDDGALEDVDAPEDYVRVFGRPL